MPEKLASQVRKIKDRVPGERKHITVLFADIKDSTALTEDRDVEDAFGFLGEVIDRMCDAVHRHGGVVSKVLGDGIMAIFGAPISFEDHAVRACRAAVEMRESIRALMTSKVSANSTEAQIRIGLNSGEVVVLAIGDNLDMEYDVIGPTVHLAARMEQTAAPGQIQISSSTFRLAEPMINVESGRSVDAKGFSTPVQTFVVTDIRTDGQRLDGSIRRGLNRLRGRESEMSVLRDVVDSACQGRGTIVGLVGAPGVGKSRLAFETSKLADAAEYRKFFVAGSPEYSTRPMHVIKMLLRNILVTDDPSDQDAILKRLEALTGKDRNFLAPFVAPLVSALGGEVDNTSWNGMEPSVRRTRMLDAIVQFLALLGERTPTMFTLEDVQWIDAESQTVLESLVPAVSQTNLLIVLTFRPEFHEPWEQRGHYRRLYIDALPAVDARLMIDDILGADPSLDELKPRLVAATGGNPLFIEESIRTLAENGRIAGDEGGYIAVGEVEAVELPLTVQAILEARIDLLSKQMKEVLHSAAVIGRTVAEDTLRYVCGQDSAAFADSICKLEDLDFLRESRVFPNREYSFLQNITRDVAYNGLVKSRRIQFHRRVVSCFEEAEEPSERDGKDEMSAILAYHAFRGELWEKAVDYSIAAARNAVSKWANRDALGELASGLEALDAALDAKQIGQTDADLKRLEILYLIAQCRYSLGEFDSSVRCLMDEKELIERVSDRSLAAQCYFWISHIQCRLGKSDLAAQSAMRSASIARSIGDLETEGKAYASLVLIHYTDGDCAAGLDAGRHAAELLEKAGDTYWLGMSQFYVGMIHMIAGEADAASRMADEVIQISTKISNPRLQCYGKFLAGWSFVASGDAARALPICAEAEQLAPDATSRAYARAFKGYAMLESGNTNQALQLLHEARQVFEEFNFPIFESWFGALEAEAILRSGHAMHAASVAQQSLAVATRIKHPWGIAWAHEVLARATEGADAGSARDYHKSQSKQHFERLRRPPQAKEVAS